MLDSRMDSRRVVAVVALASALGWLAAAPAAAAAPEVDQLGDTPLDPAALYFVSFDGLVNNASYQQSAILSFAGYQYAAWYRSNRSAVVARRRLPTGAWQLAVLPHQLTTNDSQCVSNYVTQRRSFGRAFHLSRTAQGQWSKMEIPVALNAFGRSQIVLDSEDNAYVVLPFGRIATASKASGWTDWTLRFDGAGPGAFGEVVIDRSRVEIDGALSIMYQRSSSGTTPSPLRVVDFQID